MISAILTVLVLVLVIIGLAGSWYSTHMKVSIMKFNMETDLDFFLTKTEGTKIS